MVTYSAGTRVGCRVDQAGSDGTRCFDRGLRSVRDFLGRRRPPMRVVTSQRTQPLARLSYLPDWKVRSILSNMENMTSAPTPEEASVALNAAETSRAALAARLELPTFFYGSIGMCVTVQIATASIGLAVDRGWARALLGAGVLLFCVVAAIQLARFRRLNGVWVGGIASRMVAGTANAASLSYGAAAFVSIWSAFGHRWWLVAIASSTGGLAYVLSGQHWLRAYRADPATHSRGESAAWLAVLGAASIVGLVFLVLGSR